MAESLKLNGRWDEHGKDGYGSKIKIGMTNTFYLKSSDERRLKEQGMKHNSKVIITIKLEGEK